MPFVSDPVRQLVSRATDSVVVLGRAMMTGRGAGMGIVAAAVHRGGGEVFTHLCLVPEVGRRGRAEVRLLAVLVGEQLAPALALAERLPGFEPAERLARAA
ncbi:hypothetical protein [Antarcticirhabdus aurantiaca]|uniref:Uncharacterized protein n=1 Tax=Antarcticirhabdus aurantiaca TaxID=2606717 RepID=A0ACD4NTN6_9HYPH|nr:hypothetical protein [Antarcticirhabdus aurantiaca]WAJ30210.1 hypothetical protein OXU80_08400 [Jeongeuplla avenae]